MIKSSSNLSNHRRPISYQYNASKQYLLNNQRYFSKQNLISKQRHLYQQKNNNQKDKNVLNNTHQLSKSKQSNKSYKNIPIQQAKTARIIRTINTSNSIQNNNKNTFSSPKLIAIPLIPNSSNIQTLDYSHNRITTIPKQFSTNYNQLIKLNLAYNQITNISAICYLQKLQQLYLSNNLINHIPKEIKKLTCIKIIDFSFNKLWYLSQIVSLKDLVYIRNQQLKQNLYINLQGNSVIKTNQKAVIKLLAASYNPELYQINSHQSTKSYFRKSIQSNIESNKQNIHPNKPNIFQNTLTKHHKSKSINQSLLDISAIVGNIPSQIIQQKISQFKPTSSTLSIIKKSPQQSQNLLIKPQSPPLQTKQQESKSPQNKQKANTINFSQSKLQIQSPINIKNKSLILLFQKVQNFQIDFINPAKNYYTQISDLQKKFKLTQNIPSIPQTFKSSFLSLNHQTLDKISSIKSVLQPFQKFYFSDIFNFSNQLQFKLKIINGSEINLEAFQQKIIAFYLNSNDVTQIKWYQVWLHQYRNFEKILINFELLLNSYILLWKKILKLYRFTYSSKQIRINNESPKPQQKEYNKKTLSSNKASSKKQLRNLLFSENKYQKTSLFFSEKKQSLLLSQKNSKCSANQYSQQRPHAKKPKQCQECLQCPIKDQQVKLLKKDIERQKEQKEFLKDKISDLEKQVQRLIKNTDFYNEVQKKQQEIIEQIDKIKPSTYQIMLLSQAKCIEDLIKHHQEEFGNYQFFKKNSLQKNSKNYYGFQIQNILNQAIKRKTQISNQPKIELNEFLLTEQSNQSNKKHNLQISQRTYFKSNGTLPFSNSNTAKYHGTATQKLKKHNSLSSKSKQFEYQSKFHTNYQPQYSKTLSKSNRQDIYEKSYPHNHQQKQNQKNEVFEKIIVRQFYDDKRQTSQIKTLQNKNKQKSSIKQQQTIKYQNKQNQTIKNLSISNHKYQHNRIHQNINQQILIQNNKHVSSPVQYKLTKKRSKTQNSLEISKFKQCLPFGYDYRNIDFKQNIQYQNYIKHHLRNNIKQILDQKQSLKSTRFSDKNLKSHSKMQNNKAMEINNFLILKNTLLKKDRDPHQSRDQRTSSTKKNSTGKYIKQSLLLDGK